MHENGTVSFKASYTGKQVDEDTGLYYFNARWYDSELGRFVTEDPARDGTNWYVYCSNNPLRYIDPDGNEIDDVGDTLQQSSNNTILGGDRSTVTIHDMGCVLTAYFRMAVALGYKGSLKDANKYANTNNLYSGDHTNLLTKVKGAELVTGLVNDPKIIVSYDSSKSGTMRDMASAINGKENEPSEYFATMRLSEANSEDGHTVSVNHDAVFGNDITDIDNSLGIKENDTSSRNRTDSNHNRTGETVSRIDFFKVEHLNWAQMENGYTGDKK